MAKSNSGGPGDARDAARPPSVYACLICRRLVASVDGIEKSLDGVLGELVVASFPHQPPDWTLFVALARAPGCPQRLAGRATLWDGRDPASVVFNLQIPVNFGASPVCEVAIDFTPHAVRAAGDYRLQLVLERWLLLDRTIRACVRQN